MKLKIKHLFLLPILFAIGYIVYSNYKISSTWVKVRHNWKDNASIINFKPFSKDQYYSLFSEKNTTDEFCFSLGDYIYVNHNDSLRPKFTSILHLNNDSLVMYNNALTGKQTFLRLPDSLKSTTSIDLKDKLLELKLNFKNKILIDTVYFSNGKDFAIKNSNYTPKDRFTKKWVLDNYYTINTNDYNIVMFNLPQCFILQKKGKQLYFYNILKDHIISFEAKELNTVDAIKSEILKTIKKEN